MALPTRIDSRSIRAALKGVELPAKLRITSGKNFSTLALIDEDGYQLFDQAPALQAIAAALRPLWNDGDERVEATTYSVSVARGGYHRTQSLETELQVLELNGVSRGRVSELREDSTSRERAAELAEALGDGPIELLFGDWVYRAVPHSDARPFDTVIEGRLVGSTEWTRDIPLHNARPYVSKLINRVETYRRWARTLGVPATAVDA